MQALRQGYPRARAAWRRGLGFNLRRTGNQNPASVNAAGFRLKTKPYSAGNYVLQEMPPNLSCSANRRKKPYRGTDSRKTEFFPLQRKKFPVLFRKLMENPGSRNRFPQNRGFSTSAEEIPCPVPQSEEKKRIAEQIPVKQNFFHFSGRNSLSCSAN